MGLGRFLGDRLDLRSGKRRPVLAIYTSFCSASISPDWGAPENTCGFSGTLWYHYLPNSPGCSGYGAALDRNGTTRIKPGVHKVPREEFLRAQLQPQHSALQPFVPHVSLSPTPRCSWLQPDAMGEETIQPQHTTTSTQPCSLGCSPKQLQCHWPLKHHHPSEPSLPVPTCPDGDLQTPHGGRMTQWGPHFQLT